MIPFFQLLMSAEGEGEEDPDHQEGQTVRLCESQNSKMNQPDHFRSKVQLGLVKQRRSKTVWLIDFEILEFTILP
jgi:hypothetical protein